MSNLIQELTLEEKASFVCGGTFWQTNGVERLGIPAITLTDGPHGLRKQVGEADHLGLNQSVKAVCFPSACASSSSFNREALLKMGKALGRIAKQEEVQVLLGPAMNIKRSPLCGRNFEYISEDPYVTGELATAYVQGVQSQEVATSPKHFALNNQEFFRMSNSSNASEKTMREIYLRAFEKVVKNANPYTIMAAYNKVNGTYMCDNKELLQGILRDEWGFDGIVVSDWLAVNNRVSNLEAGLDLSMPSSHGAFEAQIVAAVKEGTLEESVLDTACERMLTLIERTAKEEVETLSLDEAHELAKQTADESVVLLENDGVLPLEASQKVAFVGPFAKQPRYQGGGSSHINAYRVVGALEAVQPEEVFYVEGFSLKDQDDTALHSEAVEATKEADVVVVFAGLPDEYESEGYDRKHLELPKTQNELIEKLLQAGRKVVVVLHNGSPVILPWRKEVAALLEVYLGGEAVGETTVDVLYGKVNPSGRLAETFPLAIEDTPSYGHFANDLENTDYAEGVFVGYRHYHSNNIPVQYPFGCGLSYTTFEYSNFKVLEEQHKLVATVTVSNTGAVDGAEVVQLYVEKPEKPGQPKRELVGFDKVFLAAGESKEVTLVVEKDELRVWNTNTKSWKLYSGEYNFVLGKDVNTAVEETVVTLEVPELFTPNSTFAEIGANPRASQVLEGMMAQMMQGQAPAAQDESGAINQEMMAEMMKAMPLRALVSAVPTVRPEHIEMMLGALNQSQQF